MLGFGEKKNYASIVAPLKKIETELSTYVADQNNVITDLEQQKKDIEKRISDSQMEIKKSENTVIKITGLLSLDLDEDGIADVDELPESDSQTPTDGDG